MTEREEQLAYWEEDSDDDEEQNRCPCNGLHERCLISSSLSLEAESFLNFSDDDEDEVPFNRESPICVVIRSPRKTIHGIEIRDLANPKRNSFSEMQTTSSSTQESLSTDAQQIQSAERDPDAMVIYDLHETIRYIDNPKKRKKSSSSTERQPKKMAVKNLDPYKISAVRGFHCQCQPPCGERLSFQDIETERKHYWSLDQQAHKQYLIDKLLFDLSPDYDTTELKFKFSVQGKQVCASFFQNVYPLSKRQYSDIRTRVKQRNTSVATRSRCNQIQQNTEDIKEYLDAYAEANGEPQPNKKDINFPEGVSKLDVYTSYLADKFEDGDKVPTIRHWYRAWRDNRKQYKCPKWSTFSKCSICTDIKFQMESGGGKEAKGELSWP